MRPALALLLLFAFGCATEPWHLLPTGIRVVPAEVRANPEGLSYGLKGTDECFFQNQLFRFGVIYTDSGFLLVMRNMTEFPIALNWRKCLLVDSEEWTHSITHPGYVDLKSVDQGDELLIAPLANRLLVLVPRDTNRFVFSRPKFREPFHPKFPQSGELNVTERVILCLTYREKELVYDVSLRYVRQSEGASPLPTSKPALGEGGSMDEGASAGPSGPTR
jgi:hypothetical protein